MDVYIVKDGERFRWTHSINEAISLWDVDSKDFSPLLRVKEIAPDVYKVYEAIPDTYGVAGKWVRVDKIGG